MPETLDHPPYILSLDIGTSSARAIVYDASGCPTGEAAQMLYEMDTSPDGGVFIDADRLFDVVCAVLDRIYDRLDIRMSDLRAVATTTFWHNLVGVGADGRPVTPLISWADTRPSAVMPELRRLLDEKATHDRTGCMLHPSYLPAKLLWFARTQPERSVRAERWMSFGEYFYLRLFGRTICSLSMASGTGLFNVHTGVWDETTLAALPVERSALSPLGDVDAFLTGLSAPFSARWPGLASLPWMPAAGDGACSNIGCGCVTADRCAVMVGTSGAMRILWAADDFTIPDGLWCYRADRRRLLMGGALSNGGNVFGWMKDTLRLGSEADIEARFAAMEPDGHGLTVLPFWAGERSPGWHASARATITGVTLHTTPVDILVASMEATAYCFVGIYERLQRVAPRTPSLIASGGGLLQSPAWTRMMADALGQPITASGVAEASSRGAALLALEACGVIKDMADAPAPTGAVYEPDMTRHRRYKAAMERQQALYDLLIEQGVS
jgi:gluconokinase